MLYYLDGYNLLFSLEKSKHSLKDQRQNLIHHLQKQFKIHHLSGVLVFDGTHRKEEESGLSYKSPLIIAYASKGQSADAYIVEQIELSSHPHQITVITDDRGLSLHARSHGAKVQSNISFVLFLKKKSAKKKGQQKLEVKETPQNIKRLLKLFEEKLEKEDPESL